MTALDVQPGDYEVFWLIPEESCFERRVIDALASAIPTGLDSLLANIAIKELRLFVKCEDERGGKSEYEVSIQAKCVSHTEPKFRVDVHPAAHVYMGVAPPREQIEAVTS